MGQGTLELQESQLHREGKYSWLEQDVYCTYCATACSVAPNRFRSSHSREVDKNVMCLY